FLDENLSEVDIFLARPQLLVGEALSGMQRRGKPDLARQLAEIKERIDALRENFEEVEIPQNLHPQILVLRDAADVLLGVRGAGKAPLVGILAGHDLQGRLERPAQELRRNLRPVPR